ncbi:hypothetical protein H310_14228 [Aphanomyces invadans]|uniref:Glycoside hydrolase n=1 Tax=Aphanomyces invadans TaxID=157072 RepID=A0A024TAQ9_9STRA|nr:hypothetical protein H310_14228 [Aphanomyces invadans]ETV91133.1 hypothetical protein H310_14228 [Aphanomyces invadans]|eukprot:XP_008880260.1 hypothetical protein H310_14228 [Aphanomyces invadans]
MKTFVGSTALALSVLQAGTSATTICNAIPPHSWTQAAASNPKLHGAINELSKYAVATWYTDRWGDSVSDLLQKCTGSQVPSIVIYGLPNKDCADGFSSGGTNKDAAMYKAWVQNLVARVGSREVVYVLEPDAIGLLSNNNCAKQFNYLDNLKLALGLISAGNPNAKVYMDVASWSKRDEAAKILSDLKSAGRLHGIAINTSNYKTNAQLISTCEFYSAATGGLHCAFDTSRNYRGSIGDEWCNSASAGIGAPPGSDTGHSLVDFNLWLKVPGESDGVCNGRTPDAQVGPNAGEFFPQGFTSLWDNGYFVDKKGFPKIGGDSWPAPSPSTPSPPPQPTDAPATQAPSVPSPPPTDAPATQAPAPTTSDATTTSPTTTSTTDETNSVEPTTASTPEVTASGDSNAITSNDGVPRTTPATESGNGSVGISAQASPEEETMTPSLIILIAAVAITGVVATVLAVAYIRKRNIREKRNDFVQRDSTGIVVLGHTTPMNGLDTQRALSVL